jgi:hypothetical protein
MQRWIPSSRLDRRQVVTRVPVAEIVRALWHHLGHVSRRILPILIRPSILSGLIGCGEGGGGSEVIRGGWQGSIHGDQRSFSSVVRSNPSPVVMVNPKPARDGRRGGFGSNRGGSGARGRQGMAWYRQGAGNPCVDRGGNPIPHQGGRSPLPM